MSSSDGGGGGRAGNRYFDGGGGGYHHNNNSSSNRDSHNNSNNNNNNNNSNNDGHGRTGFRGGGGRGGGVGGGRGRGGGGGGGGFRGGGGGRGGGGRGGGRGGNNNNNRPPLKEYMERETAKIEEITYGSYSRSSKNSESRKDSNNRSNKNVIRMAVEGCCHGELEAIYTRLQRHEASEHKKIDLLVCCGDFQSFRNYADFHSAAIPPKYRTLGSFHKYYSGELTAPYPTIFVSGNHEASQALQELPYGGWVAPNIYFLGDAGVVQFGGVRIGGIGGIYKEHDYYKGRYEKPPYGRNDMRSIYHVRNLTVYRMKCLNNQPPKQSLDVMISHDWPQGIEQHGDTQGLIRRKPHFQKEIQDNCLGSPANHELLQHLKPQWWFSAHLHVKFTATVVHHATATATTTTGSSPSSSTPPATTKCSVLDLVPSSTIQSSTYNNNNNNSTSPPNKKKRKDPESSTASSSPASPRNDGKDETKTTDEPMVNGEQESNQPRDDDDDDNSPDEITTTTQFVAPAENSKCQSATEDLTDQMTRFLALDKCLPRRHFLTIVELPVPAESSCSSSEEEKRLEYDPEWLAILRKTHSLTSTSSTSSQPIPNELCTVDEHEIQWVRDRLLRRRIEAEGEGGSSSSLAIPYNFSQTVPPVMGPIPADAPLPHRMPPPFPHMGNPQTDALLQLLEVDHIVTVPYTTTTNNNGGAGSSSSSLLVPIAPAAAAAVAVDNIMDENEIDLDEEDGED